jgi:hypothetical protein
MQTAIVKYQIGSYSGKMNVLVDENDPNDVVIEKAKAQLFKEAGTALPMKNVSFTILVGEASPLENRINEVRDS